MLLRAYSPADRQSCLRVFASNIPDSFLESERADYAAFLDELPGPYFVVQDDDGEVVACGGFAVDPGTRQADLCWGMVRRDLHRRGIGDLLLRERLSRITSHVDVDAVRLDTTQFTHAYYERVGFQVQRVTPDGYGPGMHRYDMLLRVRGPRVYPPGA